MVRIETWLDCEINAPVKVQYLSGNLFSQDNGGNLIGVNVLDNGVGVSSLSGTVSANVIRSDGGTVAVAGTLSGHQVHVVLPQAAYAVPGAITIVIKLTDSNVVTTLAAMVAVVYQSATDTTVDPGTIIPSIQTLISQIETAVASIPADYSSLWAALAPTYVQQAYAVGQYCTHEGGLYRCTTAITSSETWNSSHWTSVSLGADIADLRSITANDISCAAELISGDRYRFVFTQNSGS